jgi:hypothetical protein
MKGHALFISSRWLIERLWRKVTAVIGLAVHELHSYKIKVARHGDAG